MVFKALLLFFTLWKPYRFKYHVTQKALRLGQEIDNIAAAIDVRYLKVYTKMFVLMAVIYINQCHYSIS